MKENTRLRNMNFNETFESSLIDNNKQKFILDKSMATGIKQNDVSKIINTHEEGGVHDTKELYDELKEIQLIVIDTRKRYDEVKTSSNNTEKDIQKLKRNKEQLEKDEKKYSNIISSQRADLESTKKKLENVTHQMEATVFQKDVYEFMKDGLKKDLLVLKKRNFDKDVVLMRDKTKLRTIRNEHNQKITLSKKCRHILSSMERTVNEKTMERNSKIHSLHEVLNKKQMNKQNRQVRERQIESVMIQAMTDKLTEEKELIKVFLANSFLKQILKRKMENLMLDNSEFEVSFHKIKQATSIKDCNDFIQKFLSREERYGILLSSIADKEEKLEEVREDNEILEKEFEENNEKSQSLDEMMKRSDQIPTDMDHVISGYNEKILEITRQKQLIYSWGTKFLAAYGGQRTRDEVWKKFKKNNIKELMVEVLNIIREVSQQFNEEETKKKIQQSFMSNTVKNSKLNETNFSKNMRVKTISAFENDEKREEETDNVYDDLSELDFLQHNRRAVKKNDMNRRFRIKTKPY